MDHRSSLAIAAMDEFDPQAVSRPPQDHTETTGCANSPIICRRTPNYEEQQLVGLSAIRAQLGAQGISEKGTEIIMASWKTGTQKQYSPHIKRWTMFCNRGNINPLHPSVANILNFLALTFHRGVGYESVNTARGSLSALGIVVEGCTAGSHPLVNRFMKGVFNLRPSMPRYAATWDVTLVLQWIRNKEPLHSLLLKDLTLKLVMLMALTQAARIQTLHLLILRNIHFSEDSVSILLGGSIKQCRPKFNVRTIEFKAYPKDNRLCVFKTIKMYLERTEKLRVESDNMDGKLLISYIKPHRSVSKDTVARWIKTVLNTCGINTEMFTAGSVRSASTSMAKRLEVPITTIMEKAGWSQESTFAKHYNKVIIRVEDQFQEAVLGSV